jgi:hypothetical protein
VRHHAVLGGRLGAASRAARARGRPARDPLREVDGDQLLAQLVDLRLAGIALPELLLDGLELLAQDVLALAAVELGLHAGLDAGADVRHLELAREDLRERAQPACDVALLEQRLPLLRLDAQRAGDQEGQRGGILQVGHRHLELLREVRDLLDDARERSAARCASAR